MTEIEWQLRKEIASLKRQVAQLLFNSSVVEDRELGEKWEEPKNDAPARPE